MRIFLLVIDSFGIGEMPDAAEFGDVGSNTYGNIVRKTGLCLNELIALGLNNIDGVADYDKKGDLLSPIKYPRAAFARLSEKTYAKDTTAGHYEIAGLVLKRPFCVFPHGFPKDIVDAIERAANVHFMGNEVASGTEIIQRLGNDHLKTGYPILYTSQDSVLQIAADVSVIPLEELYRICSQVRKVMVGERAVGRVIARPFTHRDGKFVRTQDRKDYALEPPGETVLDRLSANHIPVIAIGKIADIFCGRGISQSIHSKNNAEGMRALLDEQQRAERGLIFCNLVDTDMLYGHRNDVVGYAKALKSIDEFLPELEKGLKEDDMLIVTADHGCDPTTKSTDHSREYVPMLLYGKSIRLVNLGTLQGFDVIAEYIAHMFGIIRESIIDKKLRED